MPDPGADVTPRIITPKNPAAESAVTPAGAALVKKPSIFNVVVRLALIALLACTSPLVRAATFNVNTTADLPDDGFGVPPAIPAPAPASCARRS
jgi:hypothetical protein